MVNEIFLMRSIACLSIVLLHALSRAYFDESAVVNSLSVLLTFGTPTFVFISEFIISRSYKNELPAHFWKKRMKYLFLPYVLFGTIYAFSKGFEQSWSLGVPFWEAFSQLLWRHILLGDFHGYFILIIFQFYILHFFFYQYLQKWKPSVVISIAFLINIAYLSFFNFKQPVPTPIGQYIWDVYYWVPFFGWLFYFTVAYYCGRHYTSFLLLLKRHSQLVMIAPFVFGTICIALYQMDIIPLISSKRVDMLLFAMSMILFIYLVAMKIREIPSLIVVISQYSFGIYLLHPLFLAMMFLFVNRLQVSWNPIALTIVYFVGSTILSMATMHLLNKIPFGPYVVGRIGVGLKGNKKSRRSYERKEKSFLT